MSVFVSDDILTHPLSYLLTAYPTIQVVTETGVELLTARIGYPTDRMEWDAEYFQK